MKHAIIKPIYININEYSAALFKVKCGFVSVLVTDANKICIPTDADQPIGGYTIENAKMLKNALEKAIKIAEDMDHEELQ